MILSRQEIEDAIGQAISEEESLEARAQSIRKFKTGATRDTTVGKLEPWGFLSPLALHRYSEYMDKHRYQADGTVRSSDNWKRGFPIDVYCHSLLRHVFDFWLIMTGFKPRFDKEVTDPVEVACAIMFNVQGFLHEALSKGLDDTIIETRPKPANPDPNNYHLVQAHGIDSHTEWQKTGDGLFDPADLLK
jgi:hypothetical protein